MSYKIKMYKGDNEDIEITLVDENGDPIDLTGSSITFTVKENVADEEPVIQRKNEAAGGDDSQIEMTDPANGIFEIHIIPENTSSLTAKGYAYDIQVILSSGKVKTVIKDRIYLEEDVTK